MKIFKLKFVGDGTSFIPSLGANEDWQGTDEKEANVRLETGMWVLEPDEASEPDNSDFDFLLEDEDNDEFSDDALPDDDKEFDSDKKDFPVFKFESPKNDTL